MRSDMGKIVIDAYRHDDRWGRIPRRELKHRNRDDDRPSKESNSRGRYGTRELGDNLNPLFRWLRKQVDRPWNKIYSELIQTLQGGFTNMEHIKSHVLMEVEQGEIRVIDGWPHSAPRWGGKDWSELRRDDLYVDDKGIMRLPPKNRMRPYEKRMLEKQKRPEIIMLDGMTAAAKVDGIWFKADLAKVPLVDDKVIDYTQCKPYKNPDKIVYRHIKREGLFTDALHKKLNSREYARSPYNFHMNEWERERTYGDRWLYAPAIKTMSKKEIRQRIPEELR